MGLMGLIGLIREGKIVAEACSAPATYSTYNTYKTYSFLYSLSGGSYLPIYPRSASTYSSKALIPSGVMRQMVQGIFPRKDFSTVM